MIIKIGVKKTLPELVAYEEVGPGGNESLALAALGALITSKGAKRNDPGMIVYIDDRRAPSCRKEVMYPLTEEMPGIKSKTFPGIRTGFIVYKDVENPAEHYYTILLNYLERQGLKPMPGGACTSIEAIFEPDQFSFSDMDFIDEDKPEYYETEIMIPVED